MIKTCLRPGQRRAQRAGAPGIGRHGFTVTQGPDIQLRALSAPCHLSLTRALTRPSQPQDVGLIPHSALVCWSLFHVDATGPGPVDQSGCAKISNPLFPRARAQCPGNPSSRDLPRPVPRHSDFDRNLATELAPHAVEVRSKGAPVIVIGMT